MAAQHLEPNTSVNWPTAPARKISASTVRAGWRITGSKPSWAASPISTPNRGGLSRCWATCARWCSGPRSQAAAADLAVLSLLGPRLGDRAVLDVLGVDALPDELVAVPLAGGGFVRRMPGLPAGQIELDVLVPFVAKSSDWQHRLAQARVRPAGVWAYEALRVASCAHGSGSTPRTHDPPRGGLDRRSGAGGRPPGQGLYRGQETVARVHNLGKPPRMLVCCTSTGRGPARDRRWGARRRSRGGAWNRRRHVDWGPSRSRCSSGGYRPTPN